MSDNSTIPDEAVVFSRLSFIKRHSQFIGRVYFPKTKHPGYVLVQNFTPRKILESIGTVSDQSISDIRPSSEIEILVETKNSSTPEYLVTVHGKHFSHASLLCNLKEGGPLDAEPRTVKEKKAGVWKVDLDYRTTNKDSKKILGYKLRKKCKHF